MESIRECLKQIRSQQVRVLPDDRPLRRCRPAFRERLAQAQGGGKDENYAAELKALADEFQAEFLDLQLVRGEYIRRANKPLDFFKRDPIHANAEGEAVLARIWSRISRRSGEIIITAQCVIGRFSQCS